MVRKLILPKAIMKKMPRLYELEKTGKPLDEQICHVKYFTPTAQFTWFGIEYDDEGGFFGLTVNGNEKEYGYFYLDYLSTLNVGRPFPLPVERDKWFTPKKVKDLVRGVDY